MKCIVEGCTNHQHEGRFVGDICRPCYMMITTGKRVPSFAWFAKPWVGLTDDEKAYSNTDYAGKCAEAWQGGVEWAEAKLKEKNG